jgi:16S rRNA (uracil1498-N3)-methyltransferase
VELGASEIVPVQTARTIVRLDEKKAGKKTVRWNAIALAAAKQSRRGMIPKVTEPVSFSSALELSRSLDHLLIAYEKAEGMEKTRALFRAIFPGDSVGVFIGPEGGFEDWEVEAAKKAGAQVISLGARILRTETAGPAVLSALMLMLEPDA